LKHVYITNDPLEDASIINLVSDNSHGATVLFKGITRNNTGDREVLFLEYEAVIGLETHVQLHTKTKMFSSSSNNYQSAEPNTVVDPVTLALPGTLPVVNKKAIFCMNLNLHDLYISDNSIITK